MASTAIQAKGTSLKIDDATPGTADVVIGNVKSMSGLDITRNTLETTNLSSQGKEFITVEKDYGTFSFDVDVDYSDVGQLRVKTVFDASTDSTFLITLQNGDTIEFTGYVTNAPSLNISTGGKVEGSVSVLLTSDITVVTA
jgi:hypothetical protein